MWRFLRDVFSLLLFASLKQGSDNGPVQWALKQYFSASDFECKEMANFRVKVRRELFLVSYCLVFPEQAETHTHTIAGNQRQIKGRPAGR